MRVSIGNVWDATTDVLAGRAGLLAPVAALAFLLPGAVQAAVSSYGGSSAGSAALGLVIAISALVAALWGQLTVIGIASHPDTTRDGAAAAARRRLPAALLVSLVLGAAAVLALLPVVVVLAASGVDFAAAAAGSSGTEAPAAGPGAALFCFLYGLALLAGGAWLGARLIVLSPVVLHERRGIGAIGRSVALTRGLTIKLIGTALVLLIVYAVAALAARYVVFIVLRLLLGGGNLATASWLAAVAAAAVGAVFSTVVAAFAARLYVALTPVPIVASPIVPAA